MSTAYAIFKGENALGVWDLKRVIVLLSCSCETLLTINRGLNCKVEVQPNFYARPETKFNASIKNT